MRKYFSKYRTSYKKQWRDLRNDKGSDESDIFSGDILKKC